MASPGGEKPYRLYRGGRVKGRVPTGSPPKQPPRRPREIGIALVLSLVFFVVWALLGYLTFRGGVSAANKRLPKTARNALTADNGAMLSNSTSILLLGTDHSAQVSRVSDRHSDSITLLRTDPSHGRLYYLSIPRDLQVEVPGYGAAKINTAFQVGGPRLAIRTVANYTDIPVNHVIVVDFSQFRDLIDKLGGIDIVVPRAIVSKFD